MAEEKQAWMVKRTCITRFISGLERFTGLLEVFDGGLWYETANTVTVYVDKDVAVTFKEDSVVRVDMKDK